MAEKPRQASEKAEGESKQTSESAGSTKSKDGEKAGFDVKAMYPNPLSPEEEITGAELVALANQGQLYRKAQSEYDKKSVELDKVTVDNEQLVIDKDKAEAALVAMQDTERVLRTLKDVGITGKTQDSDKYGEFDETPVVDPEEVYRRVEALAQKEISKATEKLTADNAEKQYFATLQEQQETERYISDNLDSARRVTLDTHTADMPDVDEAKIESALDMGMLAAAKDAEAVNALRSRNKETFQALHFEAETLRNKAVRTLAELRIEQVQITVEKQRQQEIESISTGVLPPELQDMKPATTKADAKKNQAIRLALSKKNIAIRERSKNR